MKKTKRQYGKYIQLFLYMLAAFAMVFLSLPEFMGASAEVFSPAPMRAGDTVTIDEQPVPLSESASRVLKPTAPGTKVHANSSTTVDVSNVSEGYIMAKYTGTGSKIKLQIQKSGSKSVYTYNLSTSGSYETFPLTGGNGKYSIGVFENVSGNQYAQVLSASVDVQLRDSTLPFLYPNQYVNFSASSETVKKSNNLAQGASDQLGIVTSVYNYVVNNISYDTQKAKTVKSGYLPAVDKILSSKTGICFDYAAVMAAMLRAQRIPTRLEVGYVSGGVYHAWISTYINNVGWVNNVIYFDGKSWKMMDPTFASSGGQSSQIMEFIGNGSNYSTQYIY
ncbi:MAG: transglutaminase-like domain-containing protein [Oscillospiraceae bacterium]|jgi:hypothetical protein|nr:transglutaminase-like domain-containing protein [Oscillospiraceae bacterium]